MAYTPPKTDWVISDAVPDMAFNRIEKNTLRVREEATLPLCIEVLSSFPAHSIGRVFFHSGNKRVYTSTGTVWV